MAAAHILYTLELKEMIAKRNTDWSKSLWPIDNPKKFPQFPQRKIALLFYSSNMAAAHILYTLELKEMIAKRNTDWSKSLWPIDNPKKFTKSYVFSACFG